MGAVVKSAVAAAIISPLLAGCVIYDSTGGDEVSVRMGNQTTTAQAAPLEGLRALRFEAGSVVVRVDSNGCTQVSDFAVEVVDDQTRELTFVREKPDHCRALVPEGVELRWTYQELGLASGEAAVVRNPLRLP